jgi:hypothetical protein
VNIPTGRNITDDIVEKLFNKDYTSQRTIVVKYSWTDWHFEEITGYRDVLMDEVTIQGDKHYSVWRLNDREWCLNVCPLCYKTIIDNQQSDKLCSEYLWSIVSKHNMCINDVCQKDCLLEIIQNHFSFLRHKDMSGDLDHSVIKLLCLVIHFFKRNECYKKSHSIHPRINILLQTLKRDSIICVIQLWTQDKVLS